MLSADVRAALAVAVATLIALFGEVGFSWSYLCAGFALTVVALWVAADPGFSQGKDELAGLLVIVWGVVAAFSVSQAWLDSKTTLSSWAGAWLIWVVVSRSSRAGRRVAGAILSAAACIAGVAVVAEALGLARPRAGGLVSNPNLTVAFIGPVLVLVFLMFHRRWVGLIAVTILGFPVLLTGSRAGFLAVAAVVLVLLPAGRWRRLFLVLGGIALATAVLWRSMVNPESLAWHRWRIWGAILEMTVDHAIFGIGAGNLGEAMGPYRLAHPTEFGQWGHIIGAAESMPLGIAARVGFPGAALALVALVLWLYRCRSLNTPRVGVIVAIVIIGCFHDMLSEPAALWWWAAVLGLVTPRPPPQVAKDQAGLAWRLMPALAVTGIAAWALVQPAWANRQWLSNAPTPEAVERVVRIEPWFSDPMSFRLEALLRLPVWTWEEASEARYWSDRLLEVRSGAASSWAQRGTIDSRVIAELGAWHATIAEARNAFAVAASLEPHLPWYAHRQALLERSLADVELARGLAVRAVELEPDFVRGWILVARLELDRGNVLAARVARSKALEAAEKGRRRARTGYQFALLDHSPAQLQGLARELP